MSQVRASLYDWLASFRLDAAQHRSLVHKLAATYGNLARHSNDQFLATPISRLPTGHETGEYLTIDLGGTNLRIAFVSLLGCQQDVQIDQLEEFLEAEPQSASYGDQKEHVTKSYEQSWPIDEHLKVEKAEDLFAWVGDCLAEVVEARFHDVENMPDEIPLGITFSFPMIQAHLAQATLMPMGKGFAIASDHNLGAMVLMGYERYTRPYKKNKMHTSSGLPKLKITAIANDAVATLVSLAYSTRRMQRSKTVLGLILGTGCNAAVSMKLQALGPVKWPPKHLDPHTTEVIVNTELTIQGAAGPLHELDLITRWDKTLDANGTNPGFQPFEQMTAGAYLGELTRLIIFDWCTKGLQFDGACLPVNLRQQNALTTTWLAQAVATAREPQSLTIALKSISGLEDSPHWTWTVELAAALLEAERIVLRRSAALIAAAIMGLLLCSGDVTLEHLTVDGPEVAEKLDSDTAVTAGAQNLIVAYCGGLICLYPGYREQVQEFLDALIVGLFPKGSSIKVLLQEASEGGVIGAGVLSATTMATGTFPLSHQV
ncbi:hypothetical protein MMC13_006312 [Lambiella insularis]|nr:hypothetical protein [Lambiella insularis]